MHGGRGKAVGVGKRADDVRVKQVCKDCLDNGKHTECPVKTTRSRDARVCLERRTETFCMLLVTMLAMPDKLCARMRCVRSALWEGLSSSFSSCVSRVARLYYRRHLSPIKSHQISQHVCASHMRGRLASAWLLRRLYMRDKLSHKCTKVESMYICYVNVHMYV